MNEKLKTVRINKIEITNYKAIDHLELEFPGTIPGDDFDVLVLGSRNGVGKTSVLECCSLLFLALSEYFEPLIIVLSRRKLLINSIKSGCEEATIEGIIEVNNEIIELKLIMYNNGKIRNTSDPKYRKRFNKMFSHYIDAKDFNNNSVIRQLVFSLTGRNSNPFILPGISYFHSYRKISGLHPEIAAGEGASRFANVKVWDNEESTISIFKQEIVRLLMGQGGLFEGVEEVNKSKMALDVLNTIIKEYASGRVDKLKPNVNSTVDIRVTPASNGESFSFDSLSSGQKEIISTLYLIWKNVQECNGVVVIDEPELHLNAEWHRSFINKLRKMFPGTQFIIATHSETIFSSVDSRRRILLEED